MEALRAQLEEQAVATKRISEEINQLTVFGKQLRDAQTKSEAKLDDVRQKCISARTVVLDLERQLIKAKTELDELMRAGRSEHSHLNETKARFRQAKESCVVLVKQQADEAKKYKRLEAAIVAEVAAQEQQRQQQQAIKDAVAEAVAKLMGEHMGVPTPSQTAAARPAPQVAEPPAKKVATEKSQFVIESDEDSD
jgi:chromosome segregation ATPase